MLLLTRTLLLSLPLCSPKSSLPLQTQPDSASCAFLDQRHFYPFSGVFNCSAREAVWCSAGVGLGCYLSSGVRFRSPTYRLTLLSLFQSVVRSNDNSSYFIGWWEYWIRKSLVHSKHPDVTTGGGGSLIIVSHWRQITVLLELQVFLGLTALLLNRALPSFVRGLILTSRLRSSACWSAFVNNTLSQLLLLGASASALPFRGLLICVRDVS